MLFSADQTSSTGNPYPSTSRKMGWVDTTGQRRPTELPGIKIRVTSISSTSML